MAHAAIRVFEFQRSLIWFFWLLFGIPAIFFAIILTACEAQSGGGLASRLLFWGWVASGPAVIGSYFWRRSKQRTVQAIEQAANHKTFLKRLGEKKGPI